MFAQYLPVYQYLLVTWIIVALWVSLFLKFASGPRGLAGGLGSHSPSLNLANLEVGHCHGGGLRKHSIQRTVWDVGTH